MKYIYRINEIKTEIDFSVDELARKAEKKSGLKPGDLGPEESPGKKGDFRNTKTICGRQRQKPHSLCVCPGHNHRQPPQEI